MRNRGTLLVLMLFVTALALFESHVVHHPTGHDSPPIAEASRSPELPRPPAKEAYSANTKTRKFHRASCQYASCPNCTAKFRTRQEAIDAGYVPGGCCKP